MVNTYRMLNYEDWHINFQRDGIWRKYYPVLEIKFSSIDKTNLAYIKNGIIYYGNSNINDEANVNYIVQQISNRLYEE